LCFHGETYLAKSLFLGRLLPLPFFKKVFRRTFSVPIVKFPRKTSGRLPSPFAGASLLVRRDIVRVFPLSDLPIGNRLDFLRLSTKYFLRPSITVQSLFPGPPLHLAIFLRTKRHLEGPPLLLSGINLLIRSLSNRSMTRASFFSLPFQPCSLSGDPKSTPKGNERRHFPPLDELAKIEDPSAAER